MTRRTVAQRPASTSKKGKSEKETEETISQPPAEVETLQDTSSSAARPRRAVRKNVLYNNDQYDLDPSSKLKDESSSKPETSQPSTPKSSKSCAKSRPARTDNSTEPGETLAETALEPTSSASQELESKPAAMDSELGSAKKAGRPVKAQKLETEALATLRGAKRRKIPAKIAEQMATEELTKTTDQRVAKLEDIIYADGADLVVGAEFEVPLEDDGPPVLGPSVAAEEEQANELDDDDESSDDEGVPPSLEKQQMIRKRGRPRNPKEKKETPAKAKPNRKILRMAAGEHIAMAAATNNQRNVKLFESDLDTTPYGDNYATVISGCLAELLRKDRIIDLLTNPDEIDMIRQGGWMLNRQPRLPPLTTEKVCFAFYIDGSKVINPKDLSIDDLRPWSSLNDPLNPQSSACKPNVRRHPVSRQNGKLLPCKVDPRLAELHLTEYSARLPRDQRLRKKIFYLSRDTQIYGNVLILYDYTTPGTAPSVVSAPHGNDLLRNAIADDDLPVQDDGSPFDPIPIEGSRGGIYLKLRPTKLGWVHNKILLLDALYNKPEYLEEMNVLNDRLPHLPPLIEGIGVFAYFVPANLIVNQIHHAADGLSPWTTNPEGNDIDQKSAPRVRSSRRALEQTSSGRIAVARDLRMQTDLYLVETMSTLARCKRIRKRVIYIQQTMGSILGNVCYIYEFLTEGPLPELLQNFDPKIYSKWTPKQSKKRTISEMQQEMLTDEPCLFDDDVGMEIVEEEIIGTVMDVDEEGQETLIEEHLEDTMNGGYDLEFPDDLIEKNENPAPYYDQVRELETGHVFLTVRHKKVASSFDTVLEWIANTNTVEERGILNNSKPGHPPIVCNARAYAFFVAGSAIFPHDINRDDFSPWSHNGNAENPTCYRTKVRKLGVGCESHGSTFHIRDTDYKLCPFHLVYLYSINPRDPRMRKKIFYLMETQSKMIVSHALIIYDYNTEGDLPRLNTGQFKTFAKKSCSRQIAPMHDVFNDVSDVSEEEKECPFLMPPEEAIDGTLYLQVIDQDFWNDRNRQLQFLVNRPALIGSLGCLNNKVPDLPPETSGKGTFVFFVNGEEVNFRTLTTDRLAPWSENACNSQNTVMKRPKSAKTPLALNREQQLRVWRANAMQTGSIEYQLHVYTATLPRCPRLRKKVVYVLKNSRQLGYAMIMYSYTEPGEIPQPIHRTMETAESYLERFPHAVRLDIQQLMKTMPPSEVAKAVFEEHGVVVNANMLYYLRRQEVNTGVPMSTVRFQGDLTWSNADGAGPSTSAKIPMVVEASQVDMEMIPDGDMIVEHTEIVEQGGVALVQGDGGRSHFLNKDLNASGFVRGNQRYDALWRICQKSFGTTTGLETFDQLFKLLLEKNESRLLQQINRTFNVEIYPTDGMTGEIVEEVVEMIQPTEDVDLVQ